MNVVQLGRESREEWNQFVVQEASFALLQSWEWGEFKEKMGWQSFRVAVKDQDRIVAGAQLLIKSLPFGLASMAYIPRGPVGQWLDQDVADLLFCELHTISRKHRSICLRLEPGHVEDSHVNQVLQTYQFKPSRYTNQPRSTIIIDLSQDLNDLLSHLHQKTRYNIRYAEKKGVLVREGTADDLATLSDLLQALGQKAGFPPRDLDYLKNEWETLAPVNRIKLFVATYEGKTLAVHMSAIFGEHAVYLHGASSDEHKNLMPNYLIMWEAIKWAKAQNCQTYDLWGIPEEVGVAVSEGKKIPVSDRTDDLWGVYRFKKGFSENVVLCASAHDYVYNGLLYGLAFNRSFAGSLIEKFAVWMDTIRKPAY